MDGQIDNIYLNFSVSGDGTQKVTALDTALEKLQSTLESIDSKLAGFKNNFEGIESAIGNINLPTGKLEQAANDVERSTQKIEDGSRRIKSIEKGDIASTAFDGIEQSANKAAVSIDYLMSKQGKLDGLQNELAQAYTKLLELTQGGAGYENKDVRRLVSEIERLQSQIDKLKGSGSTAFDGIRRSAKRTKKDVFGLFKSLTSLRRMIGRMILRRTVYAALRAILTAFKDGTNNIYQFSKSINGEFAKSMDRLSTSFLYLKNGLGAATAPIITILTPALERLMDSIAEFGNRVGETIAALSGATTFKKAIKYQKEYAEAVNGTNNALAKFDEINNITTSKNKEGQNFGSMFVVEDVAVPSWISKIKKNFENGNWRGIGSVISEKLNEQVEKISKINLGKKIGSKINLALDFANGLVGTFQFGKFGTTIFGQLTDMIDNSDGDGIEWGKIGELFSNGILGAIDFIDSAVVWLTSGKPINALTSALTQLIESLRWEDISYSLVTFMLNSIENLANWSADLNNWKKFYNALLKALKGVFKGVFNALKDWFKNHSIWDYLANVFDLSMVLTNPFGFFLKKVSGYATGGYPASGEMFIARENGIPEMVGSIGGRTAVANNDQIVEAISVGVYNAYMDAMSRSGGNKQPTIVQINGKEVFRAVQDESTAYSRRTGQPAF